MAITSIDGIIAGMQPPQTLHKIATATVAGRFYSCWYNQGYPSSGATITAGIAGATLSGYTQGQIPFFNPASGNTYLARFSANSSQICTIAFCDRLWHNNGIVVTSTAVQTINSPQFPARDATGGTSGNSIMIGVEVNSLMGAGTPTFTMNYTNQNGVTATTTTAAQAATMAIGSFIPIPLASGDTGVQKVNWWQQSATMTSGAYSLVAYRIIAFTDVLQAGAGTSLDAIGLGLPRLYDNSVPFLLYFPNTTTAPAINAIVVYTQG